MIDVVLLSSGITKGMKSYGPKSIVPIGKSKTPLVIEQINILKKNKNIDHIYIVVGFESKKIISLAQRCNSSKVHFIFNDNYENTNSGGALLKILDKLNKTTIIFEDGIISYNIPKYNYSYLPILKKYNKGYGIGSIIDEKVKYLCYDLENNWAEFVCFGNKDIDYIKSIINNELITKINSMFLFEIINLLIDNYVEFHAEFTNQKTIKKIINHKVKI